MSLNIDYRRAETLALCGRLVEEAHDEGRTLYIYGVECDVLGILAKLAEHLDLKVPGLVSLLGQDFQKAEREIREEINRPLQF